MNAARRDATYPREFWPDEDRLHVPAVTDGGDGRWIPYCLGCSHAAQDWVNPCGRLDELRPWPDGILATVEL